MGDKEKLRAMALQIDDLQGELRRVKAEYRSKVTSDYLHCTVSVLCREDILGKLA